MRNPLSRLCALLLSCVLLCGCGNAQAPDDDAQLALPDPPAFEATQILGDVRAPDKAEVSIFYSPENSLDLTAVTRAIHVGQDETLLERTLSELLRTLSVTGTLRTVASAEPLIELEYSCGTACVNLTLEAGASQSDQDALLLCAAISDTLLGIEGVQAVNILAGDRSLTVSGLPLGAFNKINDNIPALHAQLQSEGNRYLTEQSISISRNALLYFPTADGEFLLPELRSLDFDSDDYASVILDALKLGPMVRTCCFSAIPGNQELLSGAPKMWVSSAGERVIDVNFTEMLPNYLAFAGVEPWQLYGSVVLSLCSFLPELDAVRICVEGVSVDSCTIGDTQLEFADGQMRRRDFSRFIGSSVQLCFAASDGRLQNMEHAMSRASALSPRQLIAEMIQAGDPGDGLTGVFPVGIQPEDILGVEVRSGIALVNLSGNFYSRCQMLDSSAERRLVYAIIHVLTQLDGIRAVRFVVEGASVDTLAQSICLQTALLPDPGIVRIEGEATRDANLSEE